MEAYTHICAEIGAKVLPIVSETLSAGCGAGEHLVINISGNSVPIQMLKHKLTDKDVLAVVRSLAMATNTTETTPTSHSSSGTGHPTVLNMGYNTLSTACVLAWADLLPSVPLVFLDVSSCDIGVSTCKALVNVLMAAAPQLQQLRLDHNLITDAGVAEVCRLVRHGGTKPNGREDAPAAYRADNEGDSSGLTALSLVHCGVTVDGLIQLSECLLEDAGLTYLDISEPDTTSRNEEIAYHLAQALRSNRHLQTLCMRKVPFLTDTTVEVLCESLLDNEGTITELDFTANRLSGVSGVSFANCLRAGANIQSLRLSHCRIGDEGAVALAEALLEGVRLRSLDLRHNSIGDIGLCALAEAIAGIGPLGEVDGGEFAGRSSLDYLLLEGNDLGVGKAGTTALGKVLLESNTSCVTDLRPYLVDGVMHMGVDFDAAF